MTILDSIRRVLAEDAAHPDLTHEVFLRQATVTDLEQMMMGHMTAWNFASRKPPSLLGLPLHIQDVARDTIVTYRAGRAISSTYL